MTVNDLFYIGSAWDSGTGFIVDGYNFIITTVQTVGFAKNVVIKNPKIKKQKVKVLFTDYSTGLAFIEKPNKVSANFDVLDFEMAVIEQIVTIYKTNYYNEFIITKTEVTSNKYQHNNINHLLLKNKKEDTSGSVIINTKNELVGITKHIEKSGANIALPAKYILKTMEEFSIVNEEAVRCTNCNNIVSQNKIIGKTCPVCSAEIMNELLSETLPAQSITDKEIEAALKNLNYDLQLSRIGHHIWEITKGSANIIIRYEPELKFIVSFSSICTLNRTNNDKIHEYLLSENKKISYFSFSIHKNKVFISTPYLIEDDFDENFAQKIFNELFEKADYYDDIIENMQNNEKI